MAAVPRPVLDQDEPTQLYKPQQVRAALLLDAVNTEITELPRVTEAFELLRGMQRPPTAPAADDTEVMVPISVAFDAAPRPPADSEMPEFRTRISLSVPELCLLMLLCLAAGALSTLAYLAYQPLT